MKDLELAKCLTDLKKQSVKLREVEGLYLKAKATEDTNFAQLFLKTVGSVEARKNEVYASKEWIDFALALAGALTELNWEKRRYDVLQMAFYAQLNTLKAEALTLGRGA